MIYGGTGLLAIVIWMLGFVMIRPAMTKAGALSEKAATAEGAEKQRLMAEAQALRERAGAVGTVATWGLVLVTAGMAVARYL
jgi:hypothetical protein